MGGGVRLGLGLGGVVFLLVVCVCVCVVVGVVIVLCPCVCDQLISFYYMWRLATTAVLVSYCYIIRILSLLLITISRVFRVYRYRQVSPPQIIIRVLMIRVSLPDT